MEVANAFTPVGCPAPVAQDSSPPNIFDGTTRFYTSYLCPYAQRVWIAIKYKELEDEIKIVPINLEHRPAWYKEKVYARNEVPVLEHNNEVIPESLDLLKYLDTNFQGPSLCPDDPSKKLFGEELLDHAQVFTKTFLKAFKTSYPPAEVGHEFDYLENALAQFNDGPFLLGQFSMADIAYAPFIERFKLLFQDAWDIDITAGRPKLATWIEELNKIEAYTKTKLDPKVLVEFVKLRFEVKK